MTGETRLRPYINIGPGDILKRNLDSLGWNQEDLAQITELSIKTISKIINNKQGITIETAKLLSKALGTSPEYWLNLDNNYRLRISADENDDSNKNPTLIKAEIRKYMPVPEIQKKGWSTVDSSAGGYQKTFKDVWHLDSFTKNVYEEKKDFCARRSKEDETYTRYYSITWLQIAENFAKTIKVSRYKPEELKRLSGHITEYTKTDEGIIRIINHLSDMGVKFFVQSHLSKTYLDGACFMDSSNPVIVYTARHNRADNFWFTLTHEIAHVLLHLSRDETSSFLDDLDTKQAGTIEQEADLLAEEILRVDEIIHLSSPFLKYFSDQNLREISEELHMDPSLVLGILQYHGYVDYRKLNKYKRKVKGVFPREIMMG